MEDFEKGAKRKCTQCSTLFFDFGKFPIICPNCGYELTSLLTNVSKRGRPPKKPVSAETKEEKEIKLKYESFTLPPKRSGIKYFTKDNISDLLEELKIFK